MTEISETITGLNIYPIKSAQAATIEGQPVQSLAVGRTGFQAHDIHDREFVLVDAEPLADGDYLFVSQRGWDERGRLDKKRGDDRLLATAQTDISQDWLTVTSKAGTLQIPSVHDEFAGEHRRIRIHDSAMWHAVDQGDEPASYFSELIGRSVRLVRDGRITGRRVEQRYWGEFNSNAVAGADGFPFLLVSESSLAQAHVESGLEPDTVPIERYRGNIIIGGLAIGAWGEDYLRRIKIGKTAFDVVKACSRCPIPNIDQNTGERAGGGLPLLREHKGRRPGDEKPQPLFGQNLNHVYTREASVAVGDEVVIKERAGSPNFEA